MRKPIQLHSDAEGLVALCDDGTMWAHASNGWSEMEPIPRDNQPSAPASAPPRTWEPNGLPIWCVDLFDNSVFGIPTPDALVLAARGARNMPTWRLVQALVASDACAVAAGRLRSDGKITVAIGEENYEIESVDVPF